MASQASEKSTESEKAKDPVRLDFFGLFSSSRILAAEVF